MSDKLFVQFSAFIYNRLGINLPHAKKLMLQSRLTKRLRQLNMKSFEEYFRYVSSEKGLNEEMPHMVNVVTTNKTDFFREPGHFDYLTKIVLPEFYLHRNKSFKIWSAGCSIGAEPYTLAMVLKEFSENHSDFQFSIYSTDISTKVLSTAINAIYDHQMAAPIPMELRKKYLLKSKDRKNPSLIRIAPELRKYVIFKQLNLMSNDYSIKNQMDVIFCRNVIIYFDRQTQERVVNRLCRYLKPGGYLFMGHSETLNMLNAPIKNVSSTVYKKIHE
ncbi:MAG: protein-glutamate O-methyltransferase [Candidatus Magnetomorum sp.]|nr:protein-glutamate O-methyltransferase [Candidatus Magnetomorum sp.]